MVKKVNKSRKPHPIDTEMEPFAQDAELFNKRVKDLMESYHTQFPHLSSQSRLSLALSTVESELFPEEEKQRRPN